MLIFLKNLWSFLLLPFYKKKFVLSLFPSYWNEPKLKLVALSFLKDKRIVELENYLLLLSQLVRNMMDKGAIVEFEKENQNQVLEKTYDIEQLKLEISRLRLEKRENEEVNKDYENLLEELKQELLLEKNKSKDFLLKKTFEIETFQRENSLLQERLAARLTECRLYEDQILDLKRDLNVLTQRIEIAEGKKLCYENQIKNLEEQVEIFVLNKAKNQENLLENKWQELLEKKDLFLEQSREEILILKSQVDSLEKENTAILRECNAKIEKLEQDKINILEQLNTVLCEQKKFQKEKDKIEELEYEIEEKTLLLEKIKSSSNNENKELELFELKRHLEKKIQEIFFLKDMLAQQEAQVKLFKSLALLPLDHQIREQMSLEKNPEKVLLHLKNLLQQSLQRENLQILELVK